MKEMGFKWSAIGHSAFYQKSAEEHTIVAIATDNMVVMSKKKVDAKRFKLDVKKFWDITNHGPIKCFLGFQIRRDQKTRTVLINQQPYIELVIEKFRLTRAKLISMPMDPNPHFSTEQSPSSINQVEKMKGVLYAEAIGFVLWATIVSRLDTAFVVGVLSQFIQNLGPVHWEGVK